MGFVHLIEYEKTELGDQSPDYRYLLRFLDDCY